MGLSSLLVPPAGALGGRLLFPPLSGPGVRGVLQPTCSRASSRAHRARARCFPDLLVGHKALPLLTPVSVIPWEILRVIPFPPECGAVCWSPTLCGLSVFSSLPADGGFFRL